MARILLVDDDTDVIEILTRILDYEKYTVRTASDGEDALLKLRAERPDLLITDIRIPKLDGWRLCSKIKEDPSLRGIPVLVMTAETDDVKDLASRENGGDAYVTKPFDNSVFVDTVKRLLGDRP